MLTQRSMIDVARLPAGVTADEPRAASTTGLPGRYRRLFAALLAAYIGYSLWFVMPGATRRPAEPPLTPAARAGRALFERHQCIACHQLYGNGGFMGPDLTNAVRRRPASYLRAVLRGGAGRMPAFGLDRGQADEIIAFLTHVDRSGTWPGPPHHARVWFER